MDIVKSPIECLDLFNYGIYFSLLFLASSQLNTFILGMIILQREMRNLKSLFTVALILSNLLACVLDLPHLILNSFSCS